MQICPFELRNNYEYGLPFLKEVFIYFESLMIEEEILERKKMITGCGVNKYDFPLFLVDSWKLKQKGTKYNQEVYDRWMMGNRIWKYANQFTPIIYKYAYLMASKGY